MTAEDRSRALELSAQALARIDAHEKDCFETRQEIKASMIRLHQRLDKIVWAILAVLAMVAWSLLRQKIGL